MAEEARGPGQTDGTDRTDRTDQTETEGSGEVKDPDVFGSARLILFDAKAGSPLPDVEVRVGPVSMGRTNEDGSLTLELFADLYHFTLLREGHAPLEVAFRILPEESIEVIAEVDSDAEEVTLSIEKADAAAKKQTAVAKKAVISLIRGTLINEETKEPYGDARIFIRGLPAEARTDEAGRFEIQVPVGVHDLVAVHAEFGTLTRSGIEVKEGAPAALTIETAATGVALDEFTVTEPRIEGATVDQLQERREANTVTDIIGAEQMSKSGDSNAASALKRVTGVTIVGDKFVYVRGLGDRYSSTMLNGLRLPSPDPERRVVPLDMFPAVILDSMTIQKTYSPEMPGEFGGGVVNLRTKGYPKKGFFKIELGTAITAGSTFTTQAVGTDHGKTDWLGIDGGHRAIPDMLREATLESVLVMGDMFTPGYTAEELAAISRSLPNNWGLEERRLPPDASLTLTGGHSLKIKKATLGFMASGIYKNEWDAVETEVKDYTAAEGSDGEIELTAANQYEFVDVTNTFTLGGILTVGADLGEDQSIQSNTIINRITDDSVWVYEGYSQDRDTKLCSYNFEWKERMLFTQQVLGSHVLWPAQKLRLDWRYAYSKAGREEPDIRRFTYDYSEVDEAWAASTHNSGNAREWIAVDDRAHDIGWDLIFPFTQWTDEAGELRAGGVALLRDREVSTRRFAYNGIPSLDIEKRRLQPPETFFADEEVIGENGLALVETTLPTDNYTGEQELFAGYLSGKIPLGLGLTATGGIRFEHSKQVVSTFEMFNPDEAVGSTIDTMDYLPAVGLTYAFWKDMLVRAGYGKTVNRPDFREMSPGCALSYAGGYEICGAPEEIDNPEWSPDAPPDVPRTVPYQLQRAEIHNVDLRWEWYFGTMESLSFGGFFKEFTNPLERMLMSGTGAKRAILFNAKGARNFGLELDFRKNFGFIKPPLEDLYVAGNATWVRSRIELHETSLAAQTSTERPLQGQSPFIVNMVLGYDNADLGTSLALLYNVFGERIATVGTSGRPDIYEQPFHQLDFVARQKLKKEFALSFKAQNLIDLPVAFTQGGNPTKKYNKGRYFTLSAGWTY